MFVSPPSLLPVLSSDSLILDPKVGDVDLLHALVVKGSGVSAGLDVGQRGDFPGNQMSLSSWSIIALCPVMKIISLLLSIHPL